MYSFQMYSYIHVLYMYVCVFVTVSQEDVVAGQDQAESLGGSIADHLEPLVKDVALQVNVLLNDVAVQVQSASILQLTSQFKQSLWLMTLQVK